MKQHTAKRVLAILLSIIMAVGLLPAGVFAAEKTYDGSEKLYVDLGAVTWWQDDNAAQKAYFFRGTENAWADLTLKDGSIYETAVPAGTWDHVILVRGNPAYTGTDYWSDGNNGGFKWDQTGDIPLDAEKNYITSFAKDSSEAAWDVYDDAEPVEPAEIPLPNGDFENGTSGWLTVGFDGGIIDNSSSQQNASHVLNIWASNDEAVSVSARYTVRLTAGTYHFTFDMDGENMYGQLKAGVNKDGTSLPLVNDITTRGWDVWFTTTMEEFTLTEPAEITFWLSGTIPAGYWAHLDNLKLIGTGGIVQTDVELDHTPTIAVEKVAGVESDSFMRGTDVSSYLSIVNSGAKFYDYDGSELTSQGFFDLLASAGFNYIRLRVWNDPFDAEGHGYGGGNCDINAALQMGQWATNAGMKVLIDFHYSDFWADPGKQKAPKSWAGFTIDQKVEAVSAFTYNSLKTLLDGGVDVGMVQVGNETTNSICGESSWANKAQIFSAGSAAIRQISAEYEHPILVAIHFTNPERANNYASQASNLNSYNVDYDVFASSWYPYWHGTTDNLTTVLKQVADTYGKQVVVAETSWAWTLDDGDGWDNTVRTGNNDSGNAYPFSVQGQADELVAATKAVTAVGEAGIGVFYWENAWIPVQYAYDAEGNLDNSILTANKAKWEEFGSGWASSYATEYDPNDAGKWFGGSAVDNQAMFDFSGKALDSLWTWQYMTIGTEDLIEKQVEAVEAVEVSLEQGSAFTLPETVKVTYNVGGSKNEPVEWDAEALAAVDVNTVGVYTVPGTVTLSYELGTAEATATVTVLAANLLQNPGFEDADMSMYALTGGSRTGDDPHSGSKSVHFYNANGGTVELSQTIHLQPGSYSFSLFTQGDAKGSTDQYIYVQVGSAKVPTIRKSFALAGWAVWQNPEIVFAVDAETDVTVGLHLAYGKGGWGTVDDLYLAGSTEAPDPFMPEYYLVGSMNEWTASDEYKLTADPNNEERFTLEDVALTAGTTLKVVDAANGIWYPDLMADYEVTEDGAYDLEFYPAGDMGEDYYGGFFKLTKAEPQPQDPVYYLVGDMNNWTAEEEYKLTEGENDEWTLTGVELAAGVALKIKDEPNNVWYPANNYVVTEAGTYDVSFYPNGTELEGYTGGVLKLTKQGEQPPEPETEYYLAGWINGEDYPTEGLGEYKFENGKLTTTFTEDSYVFIRTNTGIDYMTAGWLGNVTSATLYDSSTITNGNKLQVPGGVEVEFTLTVNDDGTLTLSYDGDIPEPQEPVYYLVGSMNEWTAADEYKLTAGENDEWTLTGVELAAGAQLKIKDEPNNLWYPDDNYVVAEAGTYDVSFYPNGTDQEGYTGGVLKLTKQGEQPPEPETEYYLAGWINGEDYPTEGLGEYKFENGKLTTTFTEDSYVFIRTNTGIDYMTAGWLGNVTSATLYDSSTITNGNKLQVPGGVEVEFTLTVNDDGTLTLSYDGDMPQPQDPVYYLVGDMNNWTAEEEYKLTEGENDEWTLTGVELTAGAQLKIKDEPNNLWYPDDNYVVAEAGTYDVSFYPKGTELEGYTGGVLKLTKQGEQPPEPETEYYLAGWINGEDYPTEGLGEYKFENGKLTTTFTEDSYVFIRTNTGIDYMTAGWLGNVTSATLYDSSTITNGNKLQVPGGVEVEFTLTVNDDGTLTLSYDGDMPEPQEPVYYLVGDMNNWTAEEEYKLTEGENDEWTLTGVELAAGAQLKIKDEPNNLWYPDDNYVVAEAGTYDVSFYPNGTELEGYTGGVLKLTKQGEQPPEPETEYYLAGWINGEDYPTEGLGEYKFENGKLTTTFTEDSYVFIRTNTGIDYMTAGWLGNVTSATLYDSSTITNGNKLQVPGGVEVEFTLTVNDDGTLTLSYDGDMPQPQDPVYYLVGDMNNWTAEEEYKLTEGENDEWTLTGVELAAGAQLKIKDEPNNLWYPDDNYVVAEAGTYDVSFYPNGTELEGYTGGVLKLTKQGEPQPEPNPIDIWFVDEVGLGTVNYYAFDLLGGDPSAEWPGTALESIGQDRNGHEVYQLTLDASVYTHVIFNNGADWQTVNLPFGEDADDNGNIVYFGNSNEADEQGHYKAWPAEDVEKIVSQTDPTCTEPGLTVFESFVTGNQRTEQTDALGHAAGEPVKENETAPTCTEAGGYDTVVRCTRCGEVLSTEHTDLEALGHDWDEGVVTLEPTWTAEGVRTYTCKRCGEQRTESIPMRMFDDVQDPTAYYYDPVYWAVRHNPQITDGISDNLFGPDVSCSRGQVVTFLWRAAGCPTPRLSTCPFEDVSESDWFYLPVLWAVENGITDGVDDTHFAPNDTCTRAQVVTFLWRANQCQEPENTENRFDDVEAGSWYYEAVLWAVENGITDGTSDTTFSPAAICTRGHVVTFLFRAEHISN